MADYGTFPVAAIAIYKILLATDACRQAGPQKGSYYMSSDTPVKMRIPRQDLQTFDTFPLSVEAASQWAQALPVTNTAQVAQQLRDVVVRLNRVEIGPELRFKIMEALRPTLLVATGNLSRRFLNLPLVMPREPRQMAELADHLYHNAGTAYAIMAVQALQRRDSIREVNAARLVCESIHRAIRFAGIRLLQTFQLHQRVELHSWLTIHQLYALAEAQQISQLHVQDTLSGSGSVSAAYLQVLLLGCSHPNKLRQNDLVAIYRGLQDWAGLLTVGQSPDKNSLFLADLDTDRPPVYRELYPQTTGSRIRYIDTEPLVAHLQKLASQDDGQGIVFGKDAVLSPALMTHLISSFSTVSMRNFSRTRTKRAVWVAIGLSNCHYYLAGEKTFEQVLFGQKYPDRNAGRTGENPFRETRARGDHWQEANPNEKLSAQPHPDRDNPLQHEVLLDQETIALLEGRNIPSASGLGRYSAHRVKLSDASPGGYCFEWTADLPGNTRTGDIVCLREDDSTRWTIAAIRWMSRLDDSKTLIGLELLSPDATPYGAYMQPQRKGDEIQPQRVLLLPGIKLTGQPPTLITPRAGFQDRKKITLARQGEESFIQLMHPVAVTSAFAQFEFRSLKQLEEVLAEDKSRPRDKSFDSLWTNI